MCKKRRNTRWMHSLGLGALKECCEEGCQVLARILGIPPRILAVIKRLLIANRRVADPGPAVTARDHPRARPRPSLISPGGPALVVRIGVWLPWGSSVPGLIARTQEVRSGLGQASDPPLRRPVLRARQAGLERL